jgi:hypothetical protein
VLHFCFNWWYLSFLQYINFFYTTGLDVRVKNEFGPSLGMKKSSSLESLQTMVQEVSTVCDYELCNLAVKGFFH